MSSTDCTDLVSITEAAKRLKVDRTTLSRYVTRYADALQPVRRGRDTLVSFEALSAHRGENINLADERPYQQPKAAAAAKARREEADAQLREIELAKAKNLLTPTAEVIEAGREAVAALNAAFDLAVQDTAERLAALTGAEARIIRPHLRKMKEDALTEFRRKLTDALETEREASAPPDA